MKWTTVPATAEPPKIVQQPESRAFVAGQTAAFNVVATSASKLTYQWTRNRVALAGATVISEPATLEIGASPNLI